MLLLMGHMARAEAREELSRINAKFTSTLVIAAAIIVAARLAREDIAQPNPRLIAAVGQSISLARTILKGSAAPLSRRLGEPMILDLSFQDLKQIALTGRVAKSGITLVIGRPLIPDVKTDTTGTRGEVRFTVDESDLRTRGPQLVRQGTQSLEMEKNIEVK